MSCSWNSRSGVFALSILTLVIGVLAAGCGGEPIADPGPTGSWSTLAPMSVARTAFGIGVIDGVLYAVGGGDTDTVPTVEAYDAVTNTWSTRAPVPTTRGFIGVGVVNGLLYAVGGSGDSARRVTVEAYDPVADSWSARAPLPAPRDGMGVGVVGGVLYAIGGAVVDPQPSRMVGTVEAYDPATNSWSPRAPMPTPRTYVGVGTVNGMLYAVGGLDDSGTSLATMEAYDPSTDSWSSRAPMPTGSLDGPEVGVVNGILYAVNSRYTQGVPSTVVEAYDPATNSWSTMTPAPTTRWWPGVGVAGGVLYVAGGWYDHANYPTLQALTPK